MMYRERDLKILDLRARTYLKFNTPDAESLRAVLLNYLRHAPGCDSERNFESDCDCGLYRLVGELPKNPPNLMKYKVFGGRWEENDSPEAREYREWLSVRNEA